MRASMEARRAAGISVALGALLGLASCGLLYTDVRTPRAYRSATPADVKASASDAAVTGTGCARAVLFLVAWGDAGYAAAARDALARQPPGAVLYDVKVDVAVRSYLLGLYTQACTVLAGRVGRP